jgi:hypothetical protein
MSASFFHHQIIRKYTTALLDTFNNLQVERTLSNNTKQYVTVPITYGSKDKAFVFNQMERDTFMTNNYNVLPRMALQLITLNKDTKRDTNKLHTINKTVDNNIITFQYNATSFIYTYELAIATRSMTELAMIVEQIAPKFNPTYNIRIQELIIQDEPTTIPVSLMSIDLDTPDTLGQDDDIRICTAICMLEVRGHMYQPFTDAAMIANVRLYMSVWDEEQIDKDRDIKLEFDVSQDTKQMIPGTLFKTDWDASDNLSTNTPNNWYLIAQDGTVMYNQSGIPVLSPGTLFIEGSTTGTVGVSSVYKLNMIDVDDETGFIYLWNVLSGNATITQNNTNPVSITPTASGVVLVQAQVVDNDGNISSYVTKNIIVSYG